MHRGRGEDFDPCKASLLPIIPCFRGHSYCYIVGGSGGIVVNDLSFNILRYAVRSSCLLDRAKPNVVRSSEVRSAVVVWRGLSRTRLLA